MNKMRLKKRIIEKICGKAGESIAETLIALLIASLALVMLASMIQSTNSLITTSKSTMDSYYIENVGLENPGSSYTLDVSIDDTGGNYDSITATDVPYHGNNTFTNKPVFAYSGG